jgi:hypothetical protein
LPIDTRSVVDHVETNGRLNELIARNAEVAIQRINPAIAGLHRRHPSNVPVRPIFDYELGHESAKAKMNISRRGGRDLVIGGIENRVDVAAVPDVLKRGPALNWIKSN